MNWLNKLERKFGKYAIHNLMYYIVILYAVGVFVNIVNPYFYSMHLSLNAERILHGEVWRLITFMIKPPDSSLIFVIFALYLYYMIGTNLERQWGAFRFNIYFFTGIIGTIAAAFVLYAITGYSYALDTNYLNMSLFFAFAATYPDYQILLFFIIPIKMKYLAMLDGLYYIVAFFTGGIAVKVAIVLSLANFIIYFLSTRNYRKLSPYEMKRKREYRQQVKAPKSITKHKCAICGRTEKDDDNLEFRFCSKCDGNYEYCSEHLYTHQHIKKQ